MNKDIIKISKITKDNHNKKNKLYKFMEHNWKKYIQSLNLKSIDDKEATINLYPIGKIIFPYFKMGNINSLDLFGLDEIFLFSFYWYNRKNYKQVADIGGNIGLHSIILSKCGYKVSTFEPDPNHFKQLKKNIKLNNINNIKLYEFAVSNKDKIAKFTRVLDNTTGSHLSGAKQKPYGKLEFFKVSVKSIKKIIKKYDLIKLDVEGEEAKIITSLNKNDFIATDIIGEISTEKNKQTIFNFCKKNNINIFSQKNNWNIVKILSELPSSHKEGSIFISLKYQITW